MKKTYGTPHLERFGTISDLSAGGSAGAPEIDLGPNDPEPNAQRP